MARKNCIICLLFLLFFVAYSIPASGAIIDTAKYLDRNSLERVTFWSNRIEREFGIPVAVETYMRVPGAKATQTAKSDARLIDETMIEWANGRSSKADPNGILLMIVKEGGLVAFSVGPGLTQLGEFDLEERKPIVSFLEQNLAASKPGVAMVGALRMTYATLNRKLGLSSAIEKETSNSIAQSEWGLLFPWAIGAAIALIGLLSFLLFSATRKFRFGERAIPANP